MTVIISLKYFFFLQRIRVELLLDILTTVKCFYYYNVLSILCKIWTINCAWQTKKNKVHFENICADVHYLPNALSTSVGKTVLFRHRFYVRSNTCCSLIKFRKNKKKIRVLYASTNASSIIRFGSDFLICFLLLFAQPFNVVKLFNEQLKRACLLIANDHYFLLFCVLSRQGTSQMWVVFIQFAKTKQV